MPSPPEQYELKIVFVGTGEACDPERRNSSILVQSCPHSILLDCGFSSGGALFSQDTPPNLDGIWFSHLHGDHFFGFPQLLVYYYMKRRTEEFFIFSSFECKKIILAAVDLAYSGLLEKLPFKLVFKTIPPGESYEHLGYQLTSTAVNHSGQASGLRLAKNNCSLYYSGDGRPTADSMALMRTCDLIIHEGFSMSSSKPSHYSVNECLLLAEQERFTQMAIIHVNTETRQLLKEKPVSITDENRNTKVVFPEDGDILYL